MVEILCFVSSGKNATALSRKENSDGVEVGENDR